MLSEAALALEVRINDDSGSVMDSVKLIASDMDGTLLNGKGELDPAFFPLFRELELRGIRFAAASGRQYDGLLRTFAPVDIPGGRPETGIRHPGGSQLSADDSQILNLPAGQPEPTGIRLPARTEKPSWFTPCLSRTSL